MTHYNPVLITVLPHERRARHPYQLCIMFCLITLSASQLIFGPPATSAVHVVDTDTQTLLNWCCLLAGCAGVVTAYIPERVVVLFKRFDFDATWLRLWLELSAHMMLFTIWVAFTIIVFSIAPFVDGLTLGSAAGAWLAIASAWRVCQIGSTIYHAVFSPPAHSAIIGQGDSPVIVINADRFNPEARGG